MLVRDGDAVLLPYGDHPVSAPPRIACTTSGGWLAGERRLAPHEDLAHRSIHDVD